jgi:diguanylate cyclase (GGDEF)-like protein
MGMDRHLSQGRDDDRDFDDQTLSDSDQTLSDADQTLSDSDQTLSDRDQTASDADQAAADADHEVGEDEPTYQHGTAIRDEGTRQRLATGVLRDEVGSERDAAARIRDERAAQRDRTATARDDQDHALDLRVQPSNGDSARVQEVTSRASAARSRAADDRARAARDRELAAIDRDAAAHERQLAGTDELTGARRRGVGLDEVQREIDRVQRTDGTLVVVFVDVDRLKVVNDRDGHHVGDAMLCAVVDGLQRHMRTYDLVVRLGGDEFLCALTDVTLEDARRRFAGLNAELREGHTGGAASLGFAELQVGQDDDLADLVQRADVDMLAAREARYGAPPAPNPGSQIET